MGHPNTSKLQARIFSWGGSKSQASFLASQMQLDNEVERVSTPKKTVSAAPKASPQTGAKTDDPEASPKTSTKTAAPQASPQTKAKTDAVNSSPKTGAQTAAPGKHGGCNPKKDAEVTGYPI